MKINGAEFPVKGLEELGSQVAKKPQQSDEKFTESLSGILKDVSSLQKDAETSMNDLMTGKEENLHGVILAMNRADLAFRYMLEIRNRLVEAYQEVMRTNI